VALTTVVIACLVSTLLGKLVIHSLIKQSCSVFFINLFVIHTSLASSVVPLMPWDLSDIAMCGWCVDGL